MGEKIGRNAACICLASPSLKMAQRFNAGFLIAKESEVPLGTAEPSLFDGAPVVPEGTGMFLSTDFPSVKTLGYFHQTEFWGTADERTRPKKPPPTPPHAREHAAVAVPARRRFARPRYGTSPDRRRRG